jgi:hypothetical protein
LRELENKLGRRWLTHESDDTRWEQYKKAFVDVKKSGNLSSETIAENMEKVRM